MKEIKVRIDYGYSWGTRQQIELLAKIMLKHGFKITIIN